MKTPSPIYPLVALGLALMFAMIGALSPSKSSSRGPAFKKSPSAASERLAPSNTVLHADE